MDIEYLCSKPDQIKDNVKEGIENTEVEVKDERYLRNRELILRAQNGDEDATEALIVENVALVKSIALKFRDRGTEFEDLMQIGTIGIIKAIRSFDLERGTCFSTYAVPMIIEC